MAEREEPTDQGVQGEEPTERAQTGEEPTDQGEDFSAGTRYEDGFYNPLEEYNNKISYFIFWKEKDPLHKNLLVQIDSYYKRLEEWHELVSENAPGDAQKIEKHVENAKELLMSAKERLEEGDVVTAHCIFHSALERQVWIYRVLDETDISVEEENLETDTNDDVDRSVGLLNPSDRILTFGMDDDTGDTSDGNSDEASRLEGFVSRLVQKGEVAAGEDWAEQTKEQLLEDDGSLKDDTTVEDIIVRYRQYYANLQDDVAEIANTKNILSMFLLLSTFILLSIFYFLWSFDTGSIDNNQAQMLYDDRFFVLVFLLGIFGSALNTVRTWPGQLRKLETPQPPISVTQLLVGVRLIIGGTAALIVYLLLMSDFTGWQVTPALILVSVFAAGFSDQFFVAGLTHFLRSDSENPSLSPGQLYGKDGK